MKRLLQGGGDAAAVAGVAVCFVSGIARVAGGFYLLGFELMTLFTGGMGLMVFACLAKLHVLSMKEPSS